MVKVPLVLLKQLQLIETWACVKKHQDIRSGSFASCWFQSGVSEKQACSGHPVNALLYWDLAVWRPGQNLGLSVAFLESFLNCFCGVVGCKCSNGGGCCHLGAPLSWNMPCFSTFRWVHIKNNIHINARNQDFPGEHSIEVGRWVS